MNTPTIPEQLKAAINANFPNNEIIKVNGKSIIFIFKGSDNDMHVKMKATANTREGEIFIDTIN
jgi:hypothetical protein